MPCRYESSLVARVDCIAMIGERIKFSLAIYSEACDNHAKSSREYRNIVSRSPIQFRNIHQRDVDNPKLASSPRFIL